MALFNILLGETTAFSVFGAVKTCKESHIKKLNFSFRDHSTSSFHSKGVDRRPGTDVTEEYGHNKIP